MFLTLQGVSDLNSQRHLTAGAEEELAHVEQKLQLNLFLIIKN